MVLLSVQPHVQALNINRKNSFVDKIVNQILKIIYEICSKSLRDNSSVEKQFASLSSLLKMCALLVSHMTPTASVQWDSCVSDHRHNGKINGVG